MASIAPAIRPAFPWPVVVIVLLLAALGWVFFDTLQAIVTVWRGSESFAHGPLIPVASLWMVWRQRAQLAALPIRPWWPALAPLAIGGFGWLLGRLAGVNVLEQFAVVGMIPVAIALVLGWRIAWALAFPLAFLLFAVPFGTFMMPTLIDLTADFTVAAIRASGIPVLREGNNFALPTGNWSVVESCSGIRYLLAAIPLACIYSYLSYHSYRARVLFIGLTVAVALVANWVRAYIIVMLGHLSGMTVAVGADHLVYGWLFFGIVMGITFWLGGFIREPRHGGDKVGEAAGSPIPPPFLPGPANAGVPRSSTLALAAAIAVLALWPLAAEQLREHSTATVDLSALAALVDAQPEPAQPEREYRPAYSGDSSRVAGVARDDPAVGVMVLHYVRQRGGAEMINDGNRPMPGKADDTAWQILSRGTAAPRALGSDFPEAAVNEYLVSGPDGMHLVWEWFSVAGKTIASPAHVKLQTALAVLGGKGDESLAWYLWTTVPTDSRTHEQARTRLAEQAWRLGKARLTKSP